ncbi:uncharacterized protein LOC101889812 [Musca domestica]|uniref:Uncharacterized protein LOC101889812 n=1 Tax=Musca domestica TaxID=7370 RepID=A0A9J7CSQ2_MUSDO|nr:uncharacterized protein LOC101889812 [Musca domestica]
MFKVSSGIFALFALLEIGVAEKSQVELNLANTILRSTSSIQYDPLKSAECFSVYLPKLNNLTAVYEEDYQLCLKKSEDSKEALRNELEPAVSVVNSTRDEICQGFAECVFDSDPYGYFECSNDAAGKAISKAYSIQTLSQDRMQYITLKYETIQYAQNVCTSKASETYVRDSTKVHAELQDCLAGKVPEESSTSTTESTSTSADSTLNTEPF